MIGPILRKVLRAAAVIYVLYAALSFVGLMVDTASQPQYVGSAPWTDWMMVLGRLVTAAVQAGILLALLSIDERMEKKV